MKNISYILGFVLLLNSILIPFASSYDLPNNNINNYNKIGSSLKQNIHAIKNECNDQQFLFNNTKIFY